MVYHGTVKNGVVVLDNGAAIHEGQRVTVYPVEGGRNASAAQAELQNHELLKVSGIVQSGRPDGSVNHDRYMAGKSRREDPT